MKRLLLSSLNVKPVNIRIVSNGVQCADLKMLKENFCISDIKDVLDGRLVKWLNNIGEKELAQKVKDSFPTPDSVIGKEFAFCHLIGSDFNNIREYAQILGKEIDRQLIGKEIKSIPRLTIELHSLYPDKYTSQEWIELFESSYECEESKQIIINIKTKLKEEEEEKEKKEREKEEDNKNKFREFLSYLVEYCCYPNCLLIEDTKNKANSWLESNNLDEKYKRRGKCLVNEGIYGYSAPNNEWMHNMIRKHFSNPEFQEFNNENFKNFLTSLLDSAQIPIVDSLKKKYIYGFFLTNPYFLHAELLLTRIWHEWNAITKEERRNKINDYLKEKNLLQFCL